MNATNTLESGTALLTPLAKGNEALRLGHYALAISHYARVIIQHPELATSIWANLTIARQKYRVRRQSCNKPRVAVCGWELSHNAAGRVYTLATIYKTFAQVEIIGSLFSQFGEDIWEPIRDTPIPKHTFVVKDENKFLENAIHLVATHPYDIVHLSKPRAPNLFFGVLYKLLWDTKVLLDIDDEELAFVKEETPISIDDYIQQHSKLPELRNLPGPVWTRLTVGLAKEFDGVTVCNAALHERYGGQIVRHARDEMLFKPSPEFKRHSRKKYGIPQDIKVVLFFGTPRAHKGLIETAQAIASLKRPDLYFFIVGTFPDETLKERLMDIQDCHYKFLPNQPVSKIPEILATADCCVFLQDTKSTVGKYQTPAKLTDALASGLPVLAPITPSLAEAHSNGAFQAITPNTLVQELTKILDDETFSTQLAKFGLTYFQQELSVTANTDPLLQAMQQNSDSRLKHLIVKLSQSSENTLLSSLLSVMRSCSDYRLSVNPSPQLSQANVALRNGRYAEAIDQYERLLIQAPELAESVAIADSLTLARQRFRRERSTKNAYRSVSVCG